MECTLLPSSYLVLFVIIYWAPTVCHASCLMLLVVTSPNNMKETLLKDEATETQGSVTVIGHTAWIE